MQSYTFNDFEPTNNIVSNIYCNNENQISANENCISVTENCISEKQTAF